MEKKRKISIAWFLFFSGLFWWLPAAQWKVTAAICAGLAGAWWLTSRIKVKFFYSTWLIFPLLCCFFLNAIGEKTGEWCKNNEPSALIKKSASFLKEINGGKIGQATQKLTEEVKKAGKIPEVGPDAKNIFLRFTSRVGNFFQECLKRFRELDSEKPYLKT